MSATTPLEDLERIAGWAHAHSDVRSWGWLLHALERVRAALEAYTTGPYVCIASDCTRDAREGGLFCARCDPL